VNSYLELVKEFCDRVLAEGRLDNPPLFADGINIVTKEYLKWCHRDHQQQIASSNLGNQQNLLRTLVGLSRFTGESKYSEAAEETLSYHFNVLQDPGGLLQWGGHRGINLDNLQIVGFSGLVHELKDILPFYEVMFKVNPEAAAKFVRGFWHAHVNDWAHLEISRHGQYGQVPTEDLWTQDFVDPEPFRATLGLSFLSAGNDLIYAAAALYKYTQDQGAWLWCNRLANMYYKARHPETNLGVYQYTQPIKQMEPGPNDNFFSCFGDRAQRQFGPELGPDALEGYMIFRSQAVSIYVKHGLMQLEVAEMLEEQGRLYLEGVLAGMLAYQKYAYIPETNMLKPLLANGRDLSGFVLQRDGYYGRKGRVFEQFPADPCFFSAWARAFSLTKEIKLWSMLSGMAKAFSLGNWGANPEKPEEINQVTPAKDPQIIFGLIDVWQATGNVQYLELAKQVADNLIKAEYRLGYFVPQEQDIAYFDHLTPLALLSLAAALENQHHLIPKFIGGVGSAHWSFHYVR